MNVHLNARMGHANLSIDTQLYTMVEQEILPGLNLTSVLPFPDACLYASLA